MYEKMISFLMNKKDQMSNDDVSEFLRHLADAFDVAQEFEILNKQSEVQNMIDSCSGIKAEENEFISNALENILHMSSSNEDDIFNDASNGEVPLRSRKIKRKSFKQKEIAEDEGSRHVDDNQTVPKADNKRAKLNDGNKDSCKIDLNQSPEFEFEIGELEENHCEGPSFDFRL